MGYAQPSRVSALTELQKPRNFPWSFAITIPGSGVGQNRHLPQSAQPAFAQEVVLYAFVHSTKLTRSS